MVRALRTRGAVLPILATLLLALFLYTPAHAQAGGGPGVHGVAGVFGGRFAQDDSPDSDLAGVRLGVGIGELLQVNGFYWRSFDVDEREFTASDAWGGEVRFALNAGFGLTPFLTGGVARVERESAAAETAATAGAGLMIPLGPILIEAGLQDYIFGLSALNGSDEASEATHNWLYNAGVSLAIGPRRRAARAPVPVPPRAPAQGAAPAPSVVDPVTDEPIIAEAQRNYHSDRSIQIPIPVEGSIQLRYGPEPVTVAEGTSEGSLSGARTDADLELMLRRIVADEVTSRLATSPMILAPGGTEGGGGAALSEARVQQIVDRTVAALLPRLEASQAQQMNALRSELNRALNQQADALMAGVAAGYQPSTAPSAAPQAVIPSAPPAAPAQPAQPADQAASQPAPAPASPAVADVPAGLSLEVRLAELRSRLAEFTSQHPAVGVVETSRGPGLSLPGQIFANDEALPGSEAADLLGPIARLAGDLPDATIYVHGHATPGGSEVSAQALSELRAEAIRSLLVQAGVEPGRIHAVGYGGAQPLSTGSRPEEQAMNRRVEIIFGLRPIAAGQ